MGLPTQRSLNTDLDSGLGDGRTRRPHPNWGGVTLDDRDMDRTWNALHGYSPVPGRRGTAQLY
ncbi:hypothetical protein [Streptomyces sp. RTd22]|uniref:hypothetical protein n=1 Tax=Streptomyces sp. RTd22 TaxID=1841249 RepID=UPI0007C4DAC4|nr:hypothetical protein [Streptomyces sp. RTd22]